MITHDETQKIIAANQLVTEDSETLLLTKRIRVLIEVSGLNRDEIHETIMGGHNPPNEETFLLAYEAASILADGSAVILNLR